MTHVGLIAAWRATADDYMRISKAYNCRSNEALKTAYIKQAAQLRMCAKELEKADAEQASNAGQSSPDAGDVPGQEPVAEPAVAQERHSRQETDWSRTADPEPSHQVEGSVDVPMLRTGDE